jgi:hypothetical protein
MQGAIAAEIAEIDKAICGFKEWHPVRQVEEESPERSFRRLLGTAAELDDLPAMLVDLDGDAPAGFTSKVVERKKDLIAGTGFRDQACILFKFETMLLDGFDVVVEFS